MWGGGGCAGTSFEGDRERVCGGGGHHAQGQALRVTEREYVGGGGTMRRDKLWQHLDDHHDLRVVCYLFLFYR